MRTFCVANGQISEVVGYLPRVQGGYAQAVLFTPGEGLDTENLHELVGVVRTPDDRPPAGWGGDADR